MLKVRFLILEQNVIQMKWNSSKQVILQRGKNEFNFGKRHKGSERKSTDSLLSPKRWDK